MTHPNSWAARRGRGKRQCEYGVKRGRRGSWESRASVTTKGARCRQWVPADQIIERGRPICTQHWHHYVSDCAEYDERINKMRRKHDPGPLPIEGD